MFRGEDSVDAEVAAEQLHEYLLSSLAWIKAVREGAWPEEVTWMDSCLRRDSKTA
jgi:hypothetical protein